MSPLTSLRSAAALFLVALLLSTSLFIPTAVGATGYPEQTIRLLIVYDDTYAVSMERNEILGDLNHRLEQMTKLAEIPFNRYNRSPLYWHVQCFRHRTLCQQLS